MPPTAIKSRAKKHQYGPARSQRNITIRVLRLPSIPVISQPPLCSVWISTTRVTSVPIVSAEMRMIQYQRRNRCRTMGGCVIAATSCPIVRANQSAPPTSMSTQTVSQRISTLSTGGGARGLSGTGGKTRGWATVSSPIANATVPREACPSAAETTSQRMVYTPSGNAGSSTRRR